MTNQSAVAANQQVECDHCGQPAVFRVAVVAWHGESLEERMICVERFQEYAADEPHRLAGVVNLNVPSLPVNARD